MIKVPPEKSDLEGFIEAQVSPDHRLESFVEASLQGTQNLEAFVAESLHIQGAKVMEIPVDIPEAPNDRLLNLWRELVFRAVSSSEDQLSIEADAVRADWNPAAHPRGPDGQFVERPWDIPDDILGMDTADIIREVARDDPDFAEKAADLQVDMEPDLMEVVTDVQEGADDVEDATDGVGDVGPLSAEQVDRITSEVRDSADFQNTIEERGFTAMEFAESRAARDALAEFMDQSDEFEADAADVHRVYDMAGSWKDDSYSDTAQTVERVYDEALGISPLYRNDTLDGRGPEAGETEAAAAITAIAQDFIQEQYGDQIQVERGIQGRGTATLMQDILTDPDREEFEARENTIANYTAGEGIANSFASGNIVIEREVDTSEVVGAPDLVQSVASEHPHEGEVWIPGGEQTVEPGSMRIHYGDETMQVSELMESDIEDWGERELAFLSRPLIELMIQRDDGDYPEAVADRMEQIQEMASEYDNTDIRRMHQTMQGEDFRGDA